MSQPHLLVDGNNLIYRSIYASLKKENTHPVAMAAGLIGSWVRAMSPSAVSVFWDTPTAEGWRRTIHPEYKEGRVHREDIGDILLKSLEIAPKLFGVSGMRQLSMPSMEADDLIYAASKMLAPRECVIVSNDRDYDQIPFLCRMSPSLTQ